jgi:DNA-binding IscR family transcriptional regulator
MITPTTQAAIAVLNDIYMGESYRTDEMKIPEETRKKLLDRLSAAGLIKLEADKDPQQLTSYRLTKRSPQISLLNILEATGEHLNCNHPTPELFNLRYGRAAQTLGGVNHMTRLYLEEIKLCDL